MRRRLTDQNLNLASFTDILGEFFVKKDFEVIKGETEKGFKIIAYDSPNFKLDGSADVTIEGEKNDFTVSLDFCKESDKHDSPVRSIFLTTMLGGGYFLLKRLKSEETFLKLEKEFWAYVENVLYSAKGSGEDSKG
jgi:hypothetical protein